MGCGAGCRRPNTSGLLLLAHAAPAGVEPPALQPGPAPSLFPPPHAENTTHDLAQLAVGAFQGWNDTLACPEEDVYGGPYPCEWWAPVSAAEGPEGLLRLPPRAS